ncbi:EAL domain-containing protein [Fodinicurvata sp. EGI_FJ10296]|uniref:EAL domain-containing protein n=1 Tax=Fodinicurvata sp. EGI_FJ10296 TaxID=3231908 RepID=UPI0034524D96
MTLNEHVRWIAAYVLGGAGLAILAPFLSVAVTPPVGVALGGLVVLGGALVHDISARNRRERRIDDFLDRVELDQTAIRSEMDDVRRDARSLARDCIRKLEEASAAGAMEALRAETRGEIRTLQAMVDRVLARVERQQPPPPDDASKAAPKRPSRQLWRSRIIEAEGMADDDLLDLVRDAVRCDRIDLALQPVVSLPQRKLRHYQAFAHLRTGDGAIITPEQFRRVADGEETGRQIDNVLLFRVAQLIRETVRRQRAVGVFTGLSPRSLSDGAFVDEMLDFVTANSELAGSIVLTLSDCPLTSTQRILEPYGARFHDAGIRLALENFGGLSDLDEGVLTGLGVRFLKMSAHRLLADAENEGITPDSQHGAGPFDDMRAMLDRVAADLVVHDIDDEQTVIKLLDYPIDFGQGVLFGEPRLR